MTNRERALFSAKQMLKPNSPYLEEHRNVAQELLNAQAQIDSLERVVNQHTALINVFGAEVTKLAAFLKSESKLLKKVLR